MEIIVNSNYSAQGEWVRCMSYKYTIHAHACMHVMTHVKHEYTHPLRICTCFVSAPTQSFPTPSARLLGCCLQTFRIDAISSRSSFFSWTSRSMSFVAKALSAAPCALKLSPTPLAKTTSWRRMSFNIGLAIILRHAGKPRRFVCKYCGGVCVNTLYKIQIVVPF